MVATTKPQTWVKDTLLELIRLIEVGVAHSDPASGTAVVILPRNRYRPGDELATCALGAMAYGSLLIGHVGKEVDVSFPYADHIDETYPLLCKDLINHFHIDRAGAAQWMQDNGFEVIWNKIVNRVSYFNPNHITDTALSFRMFIVHANDMYAIECLGEDPRTNIIIPFIKHAMENNLFIQLSTPEDFGDEL